MTAFAQNFLFLDNPGGEVEDLAAMKAAGFQGVYCNVHSYNPDLWYTIRLRAMQQGMVCGPWARIDPQGQTFDVLALDTLIKVADSWQSPFIINAEKELDNTGSKYTQIIADKVGTRDAAISMQTWIFPTVDWEPVAHLPMLLQIFPAEASAAKDPAGCKEHAHNLGIDCVYFTFGTYGGMQPSDFDLKAPYSLFTGNACGGLFTPWKPTSTGFVACKGQEELVQAIIDAWNHLYDSELGKKWRAANPKEWDKVRAYWRGIAPSPPSLQTLYGQALVDLAKARKQAEKLNV